MNKYLKLKIILNKRDRENGHNKQNNLNKER